MTAAALDREPDLLEEVLARVRAHLPGLDPAMLSSIEADIRQTLGGERVRIAKRRKHLSAQERQELFAAGMSQQPEQAITKRFQISRATLYRQMKRG